MRIDLNLAVAPSPRERYALVWTVPTTLAALVVLVVLGLAAWRTYGEYRKVHASVEGLHAEEAKARQHEAELKRELERPQLREIFRSVRFVNGLIDKKHSTVTELVGRVAELLSPQVRLIGLAMGESGGNTVVRISVTGKSEEALEKFLSNVENSDYFSDVAIISQGVATEGDEEKPVRLACSARYLRMGRQ